MLRCRHCLGLFVELYDCPPKDSNPKAKCGCGKPICRACALEQGVTVRVARSKWARALDDAELSGY